MAQTSINIRMDSELKNAFEIFCKDVGMTMTTAICVFAKKVVKENKIPFEITGSEPDESELLDYYEPNEETIAAIKETKDIIAGRKKAKAYNSAEELFADLDSDED